MALNENMTIPAMQVDIHEYFTDCIALLPREEVWAMSHNRSDLGAVHICQVRLSIPLTCHACWTFPARF
jgi:hypothetical protein